MGDDMAFVEGTYRLPGAGWQVVVVSRFDLPEPEVISETWSSGVTGIFVRFPRSEPLNKLAIERVLSGALGVAEWVETRGPDSMNLR